MSLAGPRPSLAQHTTASLHRHHCGGASIWAPTPRTRDSANAEARGSGGGRGSQTSATFDVDRTAAKWPPCESVYINVPPYRFGARCAGAGATYWLVGRSGDLATSDHWEIRDASSIISLEQHPLYLTSRISLICLGDCVSPATFTDIMSSLTSDRGSPETRRGEQCETREKRERERRRTPVR